MVRSRAAGISAITFSLLLVAAAVLVAPPSGEYSAGDVTRFTASGHRPVVLIGVYAAIGASIALLGLVIFLHPSVPSGWRELLVLGGGGARRRRTADRDCGSAAVPVGLLIGGGDAIDPRITYMFSQPGWLRAATYVGGVGGVLALAWFPSVLVVLWGLVAGASMLRAAPEQDAAVSASATARAQSSTTAG